jgi:hypothetical protein
MTEPSINKSEVIKAVKKALNEPEVSSDPNFATAKKARIGYPVYVRDSQGTLAFLIVPLLTGQKASGYVRLATDLKVGQVSIFGATANDSQSWVDASFFYTSPVDAINSIRKKYPDMIMSEPVFSFYKSAAKWGWLIKLTNKQEILILVTPSGWNRLVSSGSDFEG